MMCLVSHNFRLNGIFSVESLTIYGLNLSQMPCRKPDDDDDDDHDILDMAEKTGESKNSPLAAKLIFPRATAHGP